MDPMKIEMGNRFKVLQVDEEDEEDEDDEIFVVDEEEVKEGVANVGTVVHTHHMGAEKNWWCICYFVFHPALFLQVVPIGNTEGK